MKHSPTSSTSREQLPSAVFAYAELDERIRTRAYALYELRGREDGHDLDDWLQAEAELTSDRVKAAAA